jgi:hypothetical protein
MSTEHGGHERLLRENIRRKETIRDLRRQLAERDERIAALEGDVETLRAGFEEVDEENRRLAGDPDAKDRTIAELQAQLKTRDHRDAFNRLAAGTIREDALGDAWGMLGLDVAGDVDEQAIEAAIGSLVESRAYLRAAAPAPDAGGGDGARPDAGGAGNPTPPSLADRLRAGAPGPGPGPGAARGSAAAPPPADPATRARERIAAVGGQTANGGFRLG